MRHNLNHAALIIKIAFNHLSSTVRYHLSLYFTGEKRYPVIELDSISGKAYKNICDRITGEEVPFLNLEQNNTLFKKFSRIFKNH